MIREADADGDGKVSKLSQLSYKLSQLSYKQSQLSYDPVGGRCGGGGKVGSKFHS